MRQERSRLQPEEAGELELEIERLHHALNGVKDSRKRTPRRVLACRAEMDLARQLALHPPKPETAHQIIRHMLFASEASLVPDHQAGILWVRLLHRSRNCLDEALQRLLAELNTTRTVYPGTNLRLGDEFVSGGQRQRAPPGRADRLRMSSGRRHLKRQTGPTAQCRPLDRTTDTPPTQSPDTRTGHLSNPLRNQRPNSPQPPMSHGLSQLLQPESGHPWLAHVRNCSISYAPFRIRNGMRPWPLCALAPSFLG
ncbi:MAG: hypothetical protein OXN89_23570, partial [Bryobacterales bacterium]|nr:hypothetical protein [Bryobacterales bacterium]